MAKLLSALLFSAALMLGLGASSSVTHACPMKNIQAKKAYSPVQVAMEESDEGADESASNEEERDDEKSE